MRSFMATFHLMISVQCADPGVAVPGTPWHTHIHDFTPRVHPNWPEWFLFFFFFFFFFSWISTCLFFKTWLRRHLIQELSPVLPQNLQVLSTPYYNDLSLCLPSLDYKFLKSNDHVILIAVSLALSTLSVFQYYIQVIKILEQRSSQSPLHLALPRMQTLGHEELAK